MSEREPVEELAEEFVQRMRDGDNPSVSDYVTRYPDLAQKIEKVFPAMLLMERCGARDTPSILGQDDTITTPFADAIEGDRWGELRILREIGRGGMGIVYEAIQEPLNRRVALKILPPHVYRDPKLVERFRQEARAAASLHHTNIVPVLAFGETDGKPYYAMQFIDGSGLDAIVPQLHNPDPQGSTLRHADSQSEPFSGPQSDVSTEEPPALLRHDAKSFYRHVALIALQAAEGLAYAHEHGVLHRDVKPSNLLLDRRGTVWITDFGLAKIQDAANLTETGGVVGTMRYLAPERLSGEVSPKSDVYSLGLTLFEMLLGRPAFTEADPALLIEEVKEASVAFPPGNAIPRDLVTITLKCVAKEPERRYAGAVDLADDLRRFLRHEPISARRLRWDERLRLWMKRRPALASSIALAVLAVLLAAFLIYQSILNRRIAAAKSVAEDTSNELTISEGKLRRALKAEMRALQAQTATNNLNRRLLANNQVLLAYSQWLEDDAASAKKTLSSVEQDLRDWEWHYLQHVFGSELLTTFQCAHSPMAVAFDATGTRLAWGDSNGNVAVIDVRTGKELVSIQGDKRPVLHVAFSRGGKLLATGGASRVVTIRDTATGRVRQSITSTRARFGSIAGLAFSLDAKSLFVSINELRGGAVKRFNVANGQEEWALPERAGGGALAISRNGKTLATVGLNKVILTWNLMGNRVASRLTGMTDRIAAIRFSNDGLRLMAAEMKTVRIWDVANGKEIKSIREPAGQFAERAALSPDLKSFMVPASSSTVKIWDVATSRPRMTLKGHKQPVSNLAYSPTGEHVATCSYDRTVRLWRATKVVPAIVLRTGRSCKALAFSPDGRLLATGGRETPLSLWNGRTGERTAQFSERDKIWITAVAWDPKGRWLVTSERVPIVGQPPRFTGRIRLRELESSKEPRTLASSSADVTALHFDSEGRRLLWSDGEKLRAVDPTTGMEISLDQDLRLVTVEAAGRLTVSKDGNKTVPLQIASGDVVRGFSPVYNRGLALAPDGKHIAYARPQGTIQVWDRRAQKVTYNLEGHVVQTTALAYLPDGGRLISAGLEGRIKIWDTVTGQLVLPLMALHDEITQIAASPSGNAFASADVKGNVRIWRIER